MRHRDAEKQSVRGTDDTQDTEDVPPLAACVKTLSEAVKLSLEGKMNEKFLFVFARALKAFEITNNRRLSPVELQAAFAQWWYTAKPQLPPDADFDEWRFCFEDTFAKTLSALGSNSLQEAIRRSGANAPPLEAERYPSANLKRLVAVCYHLQQLQGSSAFFLSVRDAAKVLGTNDLRRASSAVAGLVRDGVLTVVEKGSRGGRRATRFRFNLQTAAPASNTNSNA